MQMILFETPSNPTLCIYDINAISSKAHAICQDILVVVDNTFLTPVLQRCLKLGADLVVYSTSKYIGGHADVVGGMVCMNNPELFEKVRHNQEGIFHNLLESLCLIQL
jgi:cystathionine beta-lyase/cystathionine gamma-synthase